MAFTIFITRRSVGWAIQVIQVMDDHEKTLWLFATVRHG
jgi:hypothetical protein